MPRWPSGSMRNTTTPARAVRCMPRWWLAFAELMGCKAAIGGCANGACSPRMNSPSDWVFTPPLSSAGAARAGWSPIATRINPNSSTKIPARTRH